MPKSNSYDFDRSRCARLIAVDKDERKEISGEVGKFYNIRSQIVHGGKTFEEKDRLILQKIQKHLRCSIKKAIERNEPIDDMNNNLDLA